MPLSQDRCLYLVILIWAQLLRHTASSDLSTHSLLIEDVQSENILFATMDILFIQQFGQYLFQLASTSTRVQALLRYIKETVVALEAEFKAMNDLAQRYVSIIDEDVKKQGSEVSLEFFELLVTGVPSGILKEWLVDVLTERVMTFTIFSSRQYANAWAVGPKKVGKKFHEWV